MLAKGLLRIILKALAVECFLQLQYKAISFLRCIYELESVSLLYRVSAVAMPAISTQCGETPLRRLSAGCLPTSLRASDHTIGLETRVVLFHN